jgi:hypothetical protein
MDTTNRKGKPMAKRRRVKSRASRLIDIDAPKLWTSARKTSVNADRQVEKAWARTGAAIKQSMKDLQV